MEKDRQWNANARPKIRRRTRLAAFEAYGGAFCQWCGETEYSVLALDHINNDGKEHRLRNPRANKDLAGLLKSEGYPTGYQVLCRRCNTAKFFLRRIPTSVLIAEAERRGR